MAEIRVGTSGWSYPEWVGRFYPNGTSATRMLAFYGRRFTTVEAHSTYRRLPTSSTLTRWADQLPAEFRVAPKAHLGITHRRDLDGVEERIGAFGASLGPLGDRLGPTFFSLPHQDPDLDRLDRLLGGLSSSVLASATDRPLAAFELGTRWWTTEVLDRLDKAGCTLVVVDDDARNGLHTPIPGPFAYVRLRRSRYNRSSLESWAERLSAVRSEGREVYAFFKHDDFANGPRWARRLAAALASSSASTSAPPPTRQDREWVESMLGRQPQGEYSVAVRDGDGRPSVICNSPVLLDGSPMPTRWWLVEPTLRRAVSTLEAGGGVREAEAAVEPDDLVAAHSRYAAERDRALPLGYTGLRPTGGVGGTRRGVKCLHAHYAWFLAGGDDPVGRWVDARLPSLGVPENGVMESGPGAQ